MKLLCIEDGMIPNARGGWSLNDTYRVKEGKQYNGINRHIDSDNDDVWFIVEVGCTKQSCRFLEISDIDETELAEQRELQTM